MFLLYLQSTNSYLKKPKNVTKYTDIVVYFISTVMFTILFLTPFILYISGEAYNCKSTTNDRFLRSLFFKAKLIYSLSYQQKSAERNSAKKYFFIFRFVGDIWPGILSDSSYLMNQHTAYYTTVTSASKIRNLLIKWHGFYKGHRAIIHISWSSCPYTIIF